GSNRVAKDLRMEGVAAFQQDARDLLRRQDGLQAEEVLGGTGDHGLVGLVHDGDFQRTGPNGVNQRTGAAFVAGEGDHATGGAPQTPKDPDAVTDQLDARGKVQGAADGQGGQFAGAVTEE